MVISDKEGEVKLLKQCWLCERFLKDEYFDPPPPVSIGKRKRVICRLCQGK